MNKLEQAARQILEAIEGIGFVSDYWDEKVTALREALAEQAEQEPVGEVVMESMGVGDAQIVRFRMNGRIPPVGTKLYAAPQQDINLNCKSVQKRLATSWGYVKAEQAEQEPVKVTDGMVYAFRRKGQDSFCTCDKERYEELANKPNLFEVTMFYATPVRTKDLTDEEIMDLVRDECVDMRWPSTPLFIARAVIAADREKNK